MTSHLIDGERGKVPLSCRDPMAQDLLWEYAQRRRAVDVEFSDDLEQALRLAGFTAPTPAPEVKSHYCLECSKQWFGDKLVCSYKHCPFKATRHG